MKPGGPTPDDSQKEYRWTSRNLKVYNISQESKFNLKTVRFLKGNQSCDPRIITCLDIRG